MLCCTGSDLIYCVGFMLGLFGCLVGCFYDCVCFTLVLCWVCMIVDTLVLLIMLILIC